MRKKTGLSPRMQAVADMAEPCKTAADIGCDHAFVSIYLAEKGKAERVIASDVRTGPLEIARQNIKAAGLETSIDVRMGDGLSALSPKEADVILLAGMGGMLMIDLLEKGQAVADACKQLVLQPQSDVCHVRRYLVSKGYVLARERMLVDAGKYYNVLDVRIPKGCAETQRNIAKETEEERLDLKFGGDLLRRRDETLRAYLKKRQELYKRLINELSAKQTEAAEARRRELIDELADIQTVFRNYFDKEE